MSEDYGALDGTERASGGSVDAAGAEVERIHAHLARVEGRLRTRSTHIARLTAAQRSARAEVLGWLAEYREARAYPHNDVRPFRTRIFVDRRGVPCAVGHLMLRSGEHGLVDDIMRESNLVEPLLAAGQHGLTMGVTVRH